MSLVVEFDTFSRAYQADPHSYFAELLAHQQPFLRTRTGILLVCRHEVTAAILRAREFETNYPAMLQAIYGARTSKNLAMRVMCTNFVAKNDPSSKASRKLLSHRFSVANIRKTVIECRAVAKSLMRLATDTELMDLYSTFARPLVLEVVRRHLGLGGDLCNALQGIARGLLEFYDIKRIPPEQLEKLEAEVGRAFGAFERELCEPTDSEVNVTRQLITAAASANRSTFDAFSDLVFIFVAALETTAALVSRTIYQLAANRSDVPDLMDRDAISEFIEEATRLFPSIQIVSRRPVVETALFGHLCNPQDTILVLLAASNRDPRVFVRPNNFEAGRPNIRDSLSFGSGMHTCIGASLAREVVRLAMEAVVELGLRLSVPDDVDTVWRRLGVFRTPESMPMVASPRS